MEKVKTSNIFLSLWSLNKLRFITDANDARTVHNTCNISMQDGVHHAIAYFNNESETSRIFRDNSLSIRRISNIAQHIRTNLGHVERPSNKLSCLEGKSNLRNSTQRRSGWNTSKDVDVEEEFRNWWLDRSSTTTSIFGLNRNVISAKL